MMIILFWLVFSIAAAVYADKKGRSGVGIFFLSLFLSPLVGFLAALCMNGNEVKVAKASGMKKCPACAEYVKPDAKICRYCKNPFAELAAAK
ncbi:MAG: hypothetical protein WAM96_15185 [Candidatus Acidiferrales bacterium]